MREAVQSKTSHGGSVTCLFPPFVDVRRANGRRPNRKQVAVRAALGHLYRVGPGERLRWPPNWQLCSGVPPALATSTLCVPAQGCFAGAGRASDGDMDIGMTSADCVLLAGLVLVAVALVDVVLG